MSVTGSVSRWIDRLQEGDAEAAEKIWQRYYTQLVQRARRLLNVRARRVSDEDDLVASAFDAFFRSARDGKFPRLRSRNDLWRILLRITECQAVNLLRHERRQKRGGGRVRGESALGQLLQPGNPGSFTRFETSEPSPELTVALVDTVQRLLAALDEDLRRMVVMRLEGKSVDEIAQHVSRSVSTVERRLKLIRRRWEEELVQ